jgi:hypothetical protein
VAPLKRRSLLRRLRGACGAAPPIPIDSRLTPHQMQRPVSRRHAQNRGVRPSPKRQVRVPAVAPKMLAVCSIVATALWCGTFARADEPVPPPTTTIDAPPPDPYSPPARAPKPRPKPAPRRVAPVAPVRTSTPYAPAAPVTSRPVAPKSGAAPQRRARVVRKQKQRKRPVRRETKSPPVRVALAPLAGVIASARLPLVAERDGKKPYLWLAGISFAVLAAAGTGLLTLTLRFLRPGWE